MAWTAPEGSISGASSSTAWTFVPPRPNELTPARRGERSAGQGRAWVGTWNGPKSHCGLGRSKCRLGGMVACVRARATLMSPARPATVLRWPKLLLTEPRAHDSVPPAAAKAWTRAATSMGSPKAVPLPCPST